jgi:hypothetical protein
MASIYRLSEHISDAMTEPEWLPIVGRRAAFATYEGQRLLGTVEAPIPGVSSGYPIVRFPGGLWARCDDEVILLD